MTLATLATVLAACGTGKNVFANGSPSPSAGGGGVQPTTHSAAPQPSHRVPMKSMPPLPTAHPVASHAPSSTCTLTVIEDVSGESSAEAASQTANWAILRANGWTVFAPTSQWHLTSSDAGADVGSPTGTSDSSLETWYSQTTPWTAGALIEKFYAGATDVHKICESPVERSAAQTSQAFEFTALFHGENIHTVIVTTMLTPTQSDLFVGETRTAISPASAWSPSVARTLWLIIVRAIQSPQAP